MEIVPALPADEAQIVALFARHRFALERREWFDWKYHRNPYGPALSFKILQAGRLDGAVALLPRTYWYRGRRFNGVQAVDGLMGDSIRGRGLFNEVMDFLLRQRPPGDDAPQFFLSFPSLTASMKAHEFAGWHRLAAFELHTCLLRADALGRLRGLGWLPPLLGPAWRVGRALFETLGRHGLSVEQVDRFTEGVDRFYPDACVRGDRSAAFLNWRIQDNPQDEMLAFALRERGVAVGHIAGKRLGRAFEVTDLQFAHPRVEYLITFLRHVAERDLADSVDCALLPAHPYRRLLAQAGFIRRGERGAVFVQRHGAAGLPEDPAAWEIHAIDSDW